MKIQIEKGNDIVVAYDAESPPRVGEFITVQPSNSGVRHAQVISVSYWYTPMELSPPYREWMVTCHVQVG